MKNEPRVRFFLSIMTKIVIFLTNILVKMTAMCYYKTIENDYKKKEKAYGIFGMDDVIVFGSGFHCLP